LQILDGLDPIAKANSVCDQSRSRRLARTSFASSESTIG
jgi:hypothetical protein